MRKDCDNGNPKDNKHILIRIELLSLGSGELKTVPGIC